MKLRAAALLSLGLAFAAPTASAQQPTVRAFVEGASGMEIGGAGSGIVAHRARTTVTIGAALGTRELPSDALLLMVSAELEPTASLGGTVAWAHRFTWLSLHAGVAAVLAPQSMFGPIAGARARIPLGRNLAVMVGPDLKGFPVGGDVPKDSVVIMAMLAVGIHVDL